MDALASIRVAVDKAIADGTTLDEFRRDLKGIIERTGLVLRGKFGWRSRVIFETNLRTAYMAGRWAQIQATKADFPYLRYTAVLDNRTRPQHRRWHDVVLPVDDPFWNTHYPPNGWGCRCNVMQLSARDLTRQKLKVTDPPPSSGTAPRRTRDGRIIEAPPGIDEGWDHNVGKVAQQPPAGAPPAPGAAAVAAPSAWRAPDPSGASHALAAVAQKLAVAPDDLATATATRLLAGRGFADWQKAPVGAFPVGVLPDAVRTAIGATQRAVVLSAETMRKQRANHPDLKQADYALLPAILAAPDFATIEGAANQVVMVRQIGEVFYLAVKTTAAGDENYVLSFRRTSAEDLRALRRRSRNVLIGDLEALLRAVVAAELARKPDKPDGSDQG